MSQSSEPIVGIHWLSIRHLSLSDLAIRFVFGAVISIAAGVVAMLAGSETGGLLLAFPAILPATLTLVEKDEGERKAEELDVGSVLGAAALSAFALVVWQYIPALSAPIVLLMGTGAWMVAATVLYVAFRLVRNLLRRR